MGIRLLMEKKRRLQTEVDRLEGEIRYLQIISPATNYRIQEKVQSSHKMTEEEKITSRLEKIKKYEIKVEELKFKIFSINAAIDTFDDRDKKIIECIEKGYNINLIAKFTGVGVRKLKTIIKDIDSRVDLLMELI